MNPDPRRRILHGWGRTAPSAATVWPAVTAEAARARLLAAGRRGALARGLGRAYGDAAQNGGGDVLDLAAFAPPRQRARLHADEATVTAPAGMSLGALLRLLLPRGWTLPVLPGTAHVSVGGAIAADVHGKSHHRDGAIGRHVVAITLLTPDGVTHRLSPEREAEAFWATLGGMGLTGVVLDATLRLERASSASVVSRTVTTRDIEDTMAALAAADASHRWSVAWLDLASCGPNLGRGIVEAAEAATPEQLPERARRRPFATGGGMPTISAPPLPVSAVTRASVRAFNAANLALAARSPGERVRPLEAFLFPLDRLGHWPRLYGPRGLVQYQFAVPTGAERTLVEVARRVAAGRTPIALAVLKRFGEADAAPLSFPLPGWTLALDLPAGDPEALAPLLDGCDELVAAAGGRIYLAKDSRMRADLLPAMLPRLDEWRAVRDRLDPEGRMTSDLDRRLDLSGRHR